MDILDRLLGHDAYTTHQLLLRCAPLNDEQLDRQFAIGHGSLRETFDHLIWNMEIWTDLMRERTPRRHPGPAGATIAQFLSRLDAISSDFAAMARDAQRANRLDALFPDSIDPPPPTWRTLGGGIVHVITHSMHHRAQILNMMRHLGLRDLPEGDVLSWEASTRPGGWPRQESRPIDIAK
jgi:uncharacterized damage-inducible protein DinB